MTKQVLYFNKEKWKSIPLGKLAYEFSERINDPEKSGFTRFVGLEHFISGDLKIIKYASTKGLVSAAKIFKSGDILFARRNTYLKRASQVDFSGVCSGDAFVLREKDEYIVPGFFSLIVNSDLIWKFANSNSEGTMSKRVKWRDLEGLNFLIPSIPEQKGIMALINALEISLTLSHQILEKAIILKDSFTQQTLFKDESVERKKYKIGDIISNVVAGTSINCEKHKFEEGDKGILKTSSITGDTFVYEEVKVVNPEHYEKLKCNVKEGCILFNRKNTKQLVGSSKYMDKSYENIYLPDLIWSIKVDDKVVIPKFLWFYLSSKKVREDIASLSNGTNASMVNISQKQFLKMPVFIPSKAQQKIYLKEFESIEEIIYDSQVKIKRIKALRKAIINQVF
ncbi:restriction endonuclease subunit S [Psychrobacter sp. DAB_AL62B]|uniref:restriction endonuclease subunit S n=1 Tax=Psychrobacter sp. DAB_AL62B TaxID=1028420 RepID=UPI0023814287|nr:restriction endonuclease subunit S [Psychrobacter sp. DAB_AL62B]MDE4455598.1 restriction endonuclease subunit S [Psychrobacter sp. DAB_AL62B]